MIYLLKKYQSDVYLLLQFAVVFGYVVQEEAYFVSWCFPFEIFLLLQNLPDCVHTRSCHRYHIMMIIIQRYFEGQQKKEMTMNYYFCFLSRKVVVQVVSEVVVVFSIQGSVLPWQSLF